MPSQLLDVSQMMILKILMIIDKEWVVTHLIKLALKQSRSETIGKPLVLLQLTRLESIRSLYKEIELAISNTLVFCRLMVMPFKVPQQMAIDEVQISSSLIVPLIRIWC
ncbi:uncharacterized protein LOC126792471 [Argentina anserina]|uniref:uncharacterized protein LOC126792471 n=1 Tax=Argentina anserina TaxID=57926 RepID=UPI0021765B5C|nr:uncharacterized protein LOC126792471 [Potentilla anserina]